VSSSLTSHADRLYNSVATRENILLALQHVHDTELVKHFPGIELLQCVLIKGCWNMSMIVAGMCS
jgi:hypothetical protein